MRNTRRFRTTICASALALMVLMGAQGCEQTTDSKETEQQEKMQAEKNRQVGLPNIKNFREAKMANAIIEACDREDLITYVYSEALDGTFVYQFRALGFGIPYSTQVTNPQKVDRSYSQYHVLPQAEPTGLFKPGSADATWIMAIDERDGKTHPVYLEPKMTVSSFPLPHAKYPAGVNLLNGR